MVVEVAAVAGVPTGVAAAARRREEPVTVGSM